MWVAPCSWRTRINLIFESTSASKIGIAAPPDRPKTYSTPSRSRQRINFSAPVGATAATGETLASFATDGATGLVAGCGRRAVDERGGVTTRTSWLKKRAQNVKSK